MSASICTVIFFFDSDGPTIFTIFRLYRSPEASRKVDEKQNQDCLTHGRRDADRSPHEIVRDRERRGFDLDARDAAWRGRRCGRRRISGFLQFRRGSLHLLDCAGWLGRVFERFAHVPRGLRQLLDDGVRLLRSA